jgi:two-component system response regulator HydG
MSRILVVDDEGPLRTTFVVALSRHRQQVDEAVGVRDAMKRLEATDYDLVITDLRLPDGSGLDVLKSAKAHSEDTEVILLTAYGSVESAVEAIKLGAFDYLLKPFDPEEMLIRVGKALERRHLKREVENLRSQVRERYGLRGILAESAAMRRVLDLVARVAPTDATVLLQGETGTGKELIAKAIHHQSPRARGPFVAINCGALPESLLESELFGHVKGAFTSAVASKRGLFEEADHGTLFLDEIGEATPGTQVKLLRALEEGEIRRVGSHAPVRVDVRVVAATNRNLAERVQAGAFRDDLYYRLSVISVMLPPLRDRPEDVAVLAEHFVTRVAARLRKAVQGLTPDAVAALLRYPWPGNVRELQNVLERAVILAPGPRIGPDSLPAHVVRGIPPEAIHAGGRPRTAEEMERAHILETLERLGWNLTQAADELGLARTTLWRKLKRYRGDPAS